MGREAKEVHFVEVEETIKSGGLMIAWIAKVVTCLTEKEKREGHPHKTYADIYGSMLTLAIKSIGNVCAFIEY